MNIIRKYENKKIIITAICILFFLIILFLNLYQLKFYVGDIKGSIQPHHIIKMFPYLTTITISGISCFAVNLIGCAICDHIIQMAKINKNLENK